MKYARQIFLLFASILVFLLFLYRFKNFFFIKFNFVFKSLILRVCKVKNVLIKDRKKKQQYFVSDKNACKCKCLEQSIKIFTKFKWKL